jgi:retron-type reverse transcriptase
MGKKHKHLYDNVCAFENLWLASRKARRGKRQKQSVAEFEFALEENLLKIQSELQTETYEFGNYHQFTVYEPQERIISAAPYRDRVVHHALCNVIEPILDKAMVYYSFACRENKGTHRAIQQAWSYVRQKAYVLKFDIKKYFFTIDHEILFDAIKKKITDEKILALTQKILKTYSSPDEYYFSFPNDTSADAFRSRGLPIGNLTSQLFANYFLTPLDRFIREKLCCSHYVRYMDDAVLFGNDKQQLHSFKKEIINFLDERRLVLHPKKSQVFPSQNGIRFLGFHLFPTHRRILRANLQRFKKRMKLKSKQFEQEILPWENLLCSLNSWFGYVGNEQHKKFIDGLLHSLQFVHPQKNFKFTFTSA